LNVVAYRAQGCEIYLSLEIAVAKAYPRFADVLKCAVTRFVPGGKTAPPPSDAWTSVNKLNAKAAYVLAQPHVIAAILQQLEAGSIELVPEEQPYLEYLAAWHTARSQAEPQMRNERR